MNCNCHNEKDICVDVVPIFNSLTIDEKVELSSKAIHKTYNKGDFVYQAGDRENSLFIVHQGKIKISRLSEDGKEQIIRIVGKGEFMGEFSLLSNKELTDYAEALELSSVCTLEARVVKEYIEKHPLVGLKIMEELSRRLEIMEELVEGINLHSVEWRLARFLLKMKDKHNVVILNTTKGNFASQLGMSGETLSRKLGLFQDNKYIKMITSKKIAILDIEALENIE
ncbi:MAG: Crp/Fnr family transcriptional regulator [Bacilli bacterium]|nr:Crp/Fnr family transcriptional regulator [Bacilli bacterium]